MPLKDKSCGILLSVSSLPSEHGIGCFDKAAYSFIDFLSECRQDYWQILPLCPIGKGNSPYYSPASFAGEILYIDIQKLQKQGLIGEIANCEFGKNTDYKTAKYHKLPLIKQAADNFNTNKRSYIKFCSDNSYWLDDYAIFMALKDYYGDSPFYFWNDDIKYRLPQAMSDFCLEHNRKIEFYKITQYFFFEQYFELKSYANSKGIKIIGDIPFYVSPDSADVWSNPECFELNRDMSPKLIAGVPPDIFSTDGQLWGNPIYNWEFQRKTDYEWWKKRLLHNKEMYDILRIDHFRAFADYYSIPADAKTAKNGKWIVGEGMNFWNKIKEFERELNIIAEDLGGETDEVRSLVKNTGFPNMKLLQFAFDSDLKDPFLPQNFSNNCVCYTGTHDNDTTLGWYKSISSNERLFFERLTADTEEDSPVLRLISYGMTSKADTVIIPLQDYLQLDTDCRLNTPGTDKNNWEWRFENDDLSDELKSTIIRLSKKRKRAVD